MTRLTKQVKEQIVAAAVAKAVGERPVTLNDNRDAWLKKVADYSVQQFGTDTTKLLKLIDQITKITKSIPQELLNYSSVVGVNDDNHFRLNVGGMALDLTTSNKERYICACNNYRNRIAIPADHQLAKEWDVLHQEELRIKEIQDTVRVNVTAMVNSVTTIKKLIDVWPECVELIPEQVNKPVVNLPTIKVDQLNTMIGIPSQE
ncbi:MAG: Nmad5 family putative nucleotide modification protein [Plesiomonas shigelloides]